MPLQLIQISPRASDMEAMPSRERFGILSHYRSCLILLGLSLLAGCSQLDRHVVLQAMKDEGESIRLFRSVTGPAWQISSLRLVQDDGGSILLHSDRRFGGLFRGLDPSLVDPAVRPFLFPSCNVSVFP